MKHYSKEELESSRPNIDPHNAIDFCLKKLYADRKHCIEDEIVKGLTFEELIGALLVTKDFL